MRYVCPAFVSERPTDDRFLSSVINRATIDLCARFAENVEVADPVVIRDRGGPGPVAAVVEELRRNSDSYSMVIFHHDAGTDRSRVDREWLNPMRAEWAASGSSAPLVFVVPARCSG